MSVIQYLMWCPSVVMVTALVHDKILFVVNLISIELHLL